MTDRRVTLSLSFQSEQDPGTVLAHLLNLLDPYLTAALAGTNAYAFDPNDHTDETRAHVVLTGNGGTFEKVYLDDEEAAAIHAKAIDGVLIELPVIEDFRTKTDQEQPA